MSETLRPMPEHVVPKQKITSTDSTVSSFSLVAHGMADRVSLEERRVFLVSTLERLQTRSENIQNEEKRVALLASIQQVRDELDFIDNHCDDEQGRVGHA